MPLNEQRLASVLVEFARTLVSDFSIQDILDQLANSAVEVLDVSGAGVLLMESDDRMHFVAASNELILDIERAQLDWAEGPCLTAFSSGVRVLIDDVENDPLHPKFSRQVAAAGLGAVFAFPLTLDGRQLGALDLYDRAPRALSDSEIMGAQVLSDVAAVYLFAAQARSDAEERTRELSYRALHDPLTGLPNRALFIDRLENARKRRPREGGGIAVLFIDVDHFKAVNDAHGHHIGDQALVRCAGRLRGLLRPAETVARLGGDEFVVLCDDLCNVEQAHEIAKRVVGAMASPFFVGETEVNMTVSVGVASSFDGPEAGADLLLHADAAMYRAKALGGGRVEVTSGGISREVEHRRAVIRDFKQALEDGLLALHYQQIVDSAGGGCPRVEALLRWRHPAQGDVPPPDIVEAAENTGTVAELTEWVLQTACADLRAWRRAGREELSVSVNVTARELTHPKFIQVLRQALTEAELPGDAVCIEITEGALIHDVGTAVAALTSVRSLGVEVAIDDFGTGYSSLSYLTVLPVQAIKIDRSFIERLSPAPVDQAIVAGVAQIAEKLGLAVIAEGVETAEQHALAASLGCHCIQGFLFSRPTPAKDMFPRASSVPSSH